MSKSLAHMMLNPCTHDHAVGQFLSVRLTHTSVQHGFIDFATLR